MYLLLERGADIETKIKKAPSCMKIARNNSIDIDSVIL